MLILIYCCPNIIKFAASYNSFGSSRILAFDLEENWKAQNMERAIKIINFVLIVATLLAASTFYFAEDFYHKMVAEDGPFENLTALILLVISVLFAIRFFREYKSRNRYWIFLNILIILGAFFGFGEEISWGQRIFSIESGEFFMQNNLQSETNLHNLEVGGVKINKLIFSQGMVLVFGFYFVLALILYKKLPFFTKLVDLFGVQMPRFKHTIIMLVSTGFILMIPDLRIWELWETVFVILLLMVFIDPFNEKEKVL